MGKSWETIEKKSQRIEEIHSVSTKNMGRIKKIFPQKKWEIVGKDKS